MSIVNIFIFHVNFFFVSLPSLILQVFRLIIAPQFYFDLISFVNLVKYQIVFFEAASNPFLPLYRTLQDFIIKVYWLAHFLPFLPFLPCLHFIWIHILFIHHFIFRAYKSLSVDLTLLIPALPPNCINT